MGTTNNGSKYKGGKIKLKLFDLSLVSTWHLNFASPVQKQNKIYNTLQNDIQLWLFNAVDL